MQAGLPWDGSVLLLGEKAAAGIKPTHFTFKRYPPQSRQLTILERSGGGGGHYFKISSFPRFWRVNFQPHPQHFFCKFFAHVANDGEQEAYSQEDITFGTREEGRRQEAKGRA